MKFLHIFFILSVMGQAGCAARLAEWAVGIERWRSNLEEKRVKVGDFEIAYLEGGQGPTAMLLHGFGGDKEHWTRFAGRLTDHYRVLAVDLPGFGESSRIEGLSYGPEAQAERLDQLRSALGIERMHVLGNSMGGMVAGVYTKLHQDRILSLTLIDSGGIPSPEPSELSRELAQGRNPLLVKSREDMDRLLDFSFYKRPFIPGAVIDRLYANSEPHREWNSRIFKEIQASRAVVEEALPGIRVPVLVIWGEKDRVIDVSSTKTVQRVKPDAEIRIIPECGHAPMIEKVDVTAELFLEFSRRRGLL